MNRKSFGILLFGILMMSWGHGLEKPDNTAILEHLRLIDRSHPVRTVEPTSEDGRFLDGLVDLAPFDEAIIIQLIHMGDITENEPRTTEPISPSTRSPCARALIACGESALPYIQKMLPSVSSDTARVVQDAKQRIEGRMRYLAQKALRKNQARTLNPPAKVPDGDEILPEPSRRISSPSGKTSPHKSANEMTAIHESQPFGLQIFVLIVTVLAAGGLFWLVLKRRRS